MTVGTLHHKLTKVRLRWQDSRSCIFWKPFLLLHSVKYKLISGAPLFISCALIGINLNVLYVQWCEWDSRTTLLVTIFVRVSGNVENLWQSFEKVEVMSPALSVENENYDRMRMGKSRRAGHKEYIFRYNTQQDACYVLAPCSHKFDIHNMCS